MNTFSTWEIAAVRYEKLIGKPIDECTRDEIASVRHEVQRQIADNSDGLVFVKTHHAMVRDVDKPVINFSATAGGIYIVRNPLDVAISFSHHLNASLDEAIMQMAMTGLVTPTGGKVVYEIYGSWSQHVESWTRKPQRTIHVMRYEDMLANPEDTFGKLARFLKLRPDRAQLHEAIERSSFERLSQQEDETGFSEKPQGCGTLFPGWQVGPVEGPALAGAGRPDRA